MARGVLTGVLAVWALASPAFGAAGFGTPRIVAASGILEMSRAPSVAVNANGRLAVSWFGETRRVGEVLVRRGTVAGGFSRPEVVARGFVVEPEVSVAPDGTVAVVWQADAAHGGRRYVQAAIARPGQRFGHPQTLVAVKANVPGQHVIALDGRVVAVWGQDVPGGHPEIRYAIADHGSKFGKQQTLAPAYIVPLSTVAADAGGDVIVGYDTASTQFALAALPAQGTVFGASRVISSDTQQAFPGSEAAQEALFAGPGGVAAGYGVEGVLPWRLRVAELQGDGTFGAPQTVGQVDNPPPSNAGFMGPVVALPAVGGTVAFWTSSTLAGPNVEVPVRGELDAAVQQPNGLFAAPQRLTMPETLSQYPAAAATNDLAIVTWGEGPFGNERLRYLVRSAGGFTQARALATHVVNGATLAAAGNYAIAAWASGRRMYAAMLHG